MAETAHIYVGTDPKQGDAELALEYSVRKHASIPVEFHWMRAGDPGFDDWGINWQFRKARADLGYHHTQFTLFRYAIPALAGYEGRAIYMDSDQIMLRDVAELWNQSFATGTAWKCVSTKRTCVSLIDCTPFKRLVEQGRWPEERRVRFDNRPGSYYRNKLVSLRLMDATLSGHWNCADGWRFDPQKTGVVHYTNVYSQPWKPHEGLRDFRYVKHAVPEMDRLWWQYFNEAKEARQHAS